MKLSRKSEEHRHRRNRQMAEAQRLLEDNYMTSSPTKSPQRQEKESTSSSNIRERPSAFQNHEITSLTKSEQRSKSIPQTTLETSTNSFVESFEESSLPEVRRDPNLMNKRLTSTTVHPREGVDNQVSRTEIPSHASQRRSTEMLRSTPERSFNRR